MSLWASSIIGLLLLQIVPCQAQPPEEEVKTVAIAAAPAPAKDLPRPLLIPKRDWSLMRAYADVFAILSAENSCSDFYGGPLTATTVLNDLFARVQRRPLLPEVSFQMTGEQRMIHDPATGTPYRMFERAFVNINGSFYRRCADPMRRNPPDVGNFAPGSRPARALILLHELGHLIRGKNGAWLLANDGFDERQSDENTSRVQQRCRAQLDELK